MDEKKSEIIVCTECRQEVSQIVQTFNISVHSTATMIDISATDICLGCLGDLMQRSVFSCGDC